MIPIFAIVTFTIQITNKLKIIKITINIKKIKINIDINILKKQYYFIFSLYSILIKTFLIQLIIFIYKFNFFTVLANINL